MSLQSKVSQLQLESATALRLAMYWQKLINEHGEPKATAFYTHLGLNHLEKKSYEWEGLTLSREPKEHEKLCVKGVAGAQETAKEQIAKILLTLREELIVDGLKGIKKLKPATYHELVLQASADIRSDLKDRLVKIHKAGRMLVAAELGKKTSSISNAPHKFHFTDDGLMTACTCETKQADDEDDEFDELDTLTDSTLGRVVNDTQSRLIASAAEWALLGLAGVTLINHVRTDINAGSVSYIDRAAGGAGNRVVGIGRNDEMRNRSDEIAHFEYSAILDSNTCPQCFELDGTTADSLDELPETPLADCDGGSMCRCFIVAVSL